MKVDINLEQLENGWVLTLNGKKVFCSSFAQIQRRIMQVLMEGKPVRTQYEILSEKMKEFWKNKIGAMEKEVLKFIEKNHYVTLEDLVLRFKDRYPKRQIWEVRGMLKNIVLRRLTQKGYITKPSRTSKKYCLTGKRPVAFIERRKE